MSSPVLIDTDAGVDDALALILALRSPEISVKAITTVAGNVAVQHCTRNVVRIINALELSEKPVVGEGAIKPLTRPLVTAPEVHGRDGLGDCGRWFPAKVPNLSRAVDMILTMCDEFAGRLTLVALGPLTNVALALKKKPASLRKVRRIITMGGAFRVPGNTGPVAEFNYFVDPEAAQEVLSAGLPITLLPLDLTQQVVLMRSELEYRARRRSSRLAKFIVRFTRSYMQYHRKTEGFYGGFLHDPIAVAVAIDPSLVQVQRALVRVETRGDLTRGMTVADFRKTVPKRGSDLQVGQRIEKERFLKLFHERVWT